MIAHHVMTGFPAERCLNQKAIAATQSLWAENLIKQYVEQSAKRQGKRKRKKKKSSPGVRPSRALALPRLTKMEKPSLVSKTCKILSSRFQPAVRSALRSEVGVVCLPLFKLLYSRGTTPTPSSSRPPYKPRPQCPRASPQHVRANSGDSTSAKGKPQQLNHFKGHK